MPERRLIPMSEQEKANRAAGVGARSGFWDYADERREAMMAPMSEFERSQLTKVPLVVFPKREKKPDA